MSDTITCPSCQRTLRVPESLLGQLVKCPTCQQTFTAALAGDADGPAEAPPPKKEAPRRERYEDEPPRPSRREDYDDRRRREDEEDRPRRRRRYQQAHRGQLILILGVLSFFFAWPILGIIAWVLGSNDLKEMRAGRMDPEGESQTNTGRICGMISTLMGAVVALLCCSIYGIILMAGAAGAAAH
jgi:predicted Zn finger-like uncharacterized protein